MDDRLEKWTIFLCGNVEKERADISKNDVSMGGSVRKRDVIACEESVKSSSKPWKMLIA